MNRHEWLVHEMTVPQVVSLGRILGFQDEIEFIVGDMYSLERWNVKKWS